MMRLIARSGPQALAAAPRQRSRAAEPASKRPSARPVWALVTPWDTSATGGVSQVVLNLADGLRREGSYEPVIIVDDWSAAWPRTELRDGVRYVFIRLRAPFGAAAQGLDQVRHRLLGWLEGRRFGRLLRRLEARVVNFHYPTPTAMRVLASPDRAALRIIFSLHGLDIVEAVQRGSDYRRTYLRMLAEGDAIVAVSQGFADHVTAHLAPELAGKITIIHNGVAPERLTADAAFDRPLPARYLLNLATFEAKKGQLHLIEAFARIAVAYPDLDLVIAGRPGGTLDAVRHKIGALGLDHRVHLLLDVPHEKIGALLASATLFCLSSLAEPFGIVLLEAGLFALPVIATRVGGVPEIIGDGEHGLLVTPGDPVALAGAIRKMLDAPERAASLAAALRQRVLSEFLWPRAVERYLALAAAAPADAVSHRF
jgi:glycosyltransferase involved in cell wall biosynthesis